MSNHLHVVMRIDPRKVATWSDREVVMRWRRLYPAGRDAEGQALEPTKDQMSTWLADTETLALWRERLGDLSWVMRSLNEPLARRANKEDKCKGRFWEGRFKSQLLCDAGAVMACMAYVDLNPVRAGLADTPEANEFTSVRERFQSECAARGQSMKQKSESSDREAETPQHTAVWLTPVEDIVVDDEVRIRSANVISNPGRNSPPFLPPPAQAGVKIVLFPNVAGEGAPMTSPFPPWAFSSISAPPNTRRSMP